MYQRLVERLRSWAEAMEGVDDPRGDHLLTLEDRVSRLEGEVGSLRESAKKDMAPPVVYGSTRK